MGRSFVNRIGRPASTIRPKDGRDGCDSAIADEIERIADRPLTPGDVQALKNALFDESDGFQAVLQSERAYLVIGIYSGAEKRRFRTVKDVLGQRRADDHAFLLADLPDFARNLALKFHVLARRVDYVVGVFEHNRGGHEWEAGALSAPSLRRKTWVLKRAYPTDAEERRAFDAMIAHFFDLLAEEGQLIEWRTDAELREGTRSKVP